MKIIRTTIALSILLLIIGCNTPEQDIDVNLDTATVESPDQTKFCALTAIDESDGRFLMVDELFSENIICTTNDDCYNYLLEQDDYRDMAPEFEPYLNCEKEKIDPNKLG